MKTKFKVIFVMIISFLLISHIAAQPNKGKAKKFINRTNSILATARTAVSQGKVYTGNLVNAVYHQRLARSLYKEGKIKKAVHHSQRARMYAFAAIKANNGKVTKGMETQADEQSIVADMPPNDQLDAEVQIEATATDLSVLGETEVNVD